MGMARFGHDGAAAEGDGGAGKNLLISGWLQRQKGAMTLLQAQPNCALPKSGAACLHGPFDSDLEAQFASKACSLPAAPQPYADAPQLLRHH